MQYSDYLLVREDIIRIQSAFRGYQEREWLGFQHECAVIIQSSARCFLNRTNVLERKLAQVVLQAKLASLQQKNCAKKIQQTWKNRVNHAKEKEAALIIEQFFITVRKEVDAELARLEQNTPKVKKVKKRKKKRKEKESEDKLLERVWLNTVESMDESAMKRTSQRRSMKSPGIHRSRSEMLGFPAESIDADDDASVVSGITSASFFAKSPPAPNPSSRFKTYNRNQLNDDYSLEEAWVDTEVNHMKEKTRSDDRYMKRYGLDMSPRVVTSREQDRHRGGISRSQSYTERSPASKIRSSRSNSQRQSGFSLSTTISRSGSNGDYPEIRESRTDTRESRTDIRRSDRMKRSSRTPLPRAGNCAESQLASCQDAAGGVDLCRRWRWRAEVGRRLVKKGFLLVKNTLLAIWRHAIASSTGAASLPRIPFLHIDYGLLTAGFTNYQTRTPDCELLRITDYYQLRPSTY